MSYQFGIAPWKFKARIATVCLFSMVATGASAHDFFILPSEFVAARGVPVKVDLTIASKFPKLENIVTVDRITELRAVDAQGVVFETVGPGPQSLITRFLSNTRGLAVLEARVRPVEVNYPEERIAEILEEYQISSETVKSVELLTRPRILKLLISRFAKSFVCVDRCNGGTDPTKPLGHNLEFVAEGPAARTFTLLANGEPLANYPVVVAQPDGTRHRAMTTAAGHVEVPAGLTGPVMLFAAAMQSPLEGSERFALDLASLTLAGR